MRTVGHARQRPARATVHDGDGEYVIELDVVDFTEDELAIEARGRRLTVRGEQVAAGEDDGEAFRLRARLEESFLLPDDAALDAVRVSFRPGTLEIHAPRAPLESRRLSIEHPAYLSNPNAEPC